MPKLRDYFFMDLESFFNLDEFAEEAVVNGQLVKVIIDNDQLADKKLKSNDPSNGVFESDLQIYVRASDLNPRPQVGDVFELNQKIYRITEMEESMGIYSITLAGNFS